MLFKTEGVSALPLRAKNKHSVYLQNDIPGIKNIFLTGSTYFGDYTEESDWDYVLHIPDFVEGSLPSGWKDCMGEGNNKEETYSGRDLFIYRRALGDDDVNIIICKDYYEYAAWYRTSELARRLGIPKEDRPVLFNGVRDLCLDLHHGRDLRGIRA